MYGQVGQQQKPSKTVTAPSPFQHTAHFQPEGQIAFPFQGVGNRDLARQLNPAAEQI